MEGKIATPSTFLDFGRYNNAETVNRLGIATFHIESFHLLGETVYTAKGSARTTHPIGWVLLFLGETANVPSNR